MYCVPVQIRDFSEDTWKWGLDTSFSENSVRTVNFRKDVELGKVMIHSNGSQVPPTGTGIPNCWASRLSSLGVRPPLKG
jgi:hypothetical protein